MSEFNRRSPHDWRAWALVLACLSQTGLASAQSQSSPFEPVTLDKKIASRLILAQTKPDYPPLARVNYIQGKVRLQVSVSKQGKVTEANVVQGHPFLAVAALAAVRNWLYKPFVTEAGAASFVTFVDVNFALRNMKVDRVPPEPERDLSRQVRPPEILEKPDVHSPLVHLRVLVSDSGQALDVNPVPGFPFHYNAALKSAGQCRFQAARWGQLTVPWYVEVDVPLEDQLIPGLPAVEP